MANIQIPEYEIFVPINGYEGTYEISNHARVKSLQRTKNCGTNLKSTRTYPERILKPGIIKGYAQVVLCKDGLTRMFKVHTLVGLHFCDGYFEGAQINHDDGNKLNNYPYNLIWSTGKQNVQHAYRTGLKTGKKGKDSHFSKSVLHVPTGAVYDTIKDAAKSNKLDCSTLSGFFNNFPSFCASPKMRKKLSEFVLQ